MNLVTTAGVANAIENSGKFSSFVLESFIRFTQHDWGEMCEEDIAENNNALKNGYRLFASYDIPDDLRECANDEFKLWIITEADRSVTTILFPSEY